MEERLARHVSWAGNEIAKRTASASTLLIDGKGQHHDGMSFTSPMPETTNSVGLTTYMDGTANVTPTIRLDLLTFGSNLADMYRRPALSNSVTRGETTWTDADEDGTKPALDALDRYVIWLGGEAVIDYDRFETAATEQTAHRFDWLLTGTKYDSADLPVDCDVQTDGSADPYYLYTANGMPSGSPAAYLRYSGRTGATDGIQYASTSPNSPTREQLNRYEFKPVISGSCVSVVGAGSSTSGVISQGTSPAAADAVQVKVADAYSSALEVRRTTVGDGGTIRGHALARTQQRPDGMFLTVLRPNGPFWTGGGDPPIPITTGFSGVTGGERVKVFFPDYDVDAFFHDPGSGSASYSDTANYTLQGRAAVQVRNQNSEQYIFGLQLIYGTLFRNGASAIEINASDTANISATYLWASDTASSPFEVVGWLESPTTTGAVTYEIYAPFVVNAISVGSTNITSFANIPGSRVRFTTSAEGALSIRASSSSTATPPYTVCGG